MPFRILPIQASPFYPSAPGVLDRSGRRESVLDVPPGLFDSLIGSRLEVKGFVLDGPPLEVTNADGFDVVP